MDKKVYVGIFNTKLEEFFKELCEAFPEIKQFSSIKTGFTFWKNLDEKKPQEFFNSYVYNKYKDQILQQNEEFFMKTDYEIYSKSKEYWVEFIDNIRNIWTTLDEDNKLVIWKYFNILIVLNEKCKNA
jgi:hypothetical protein